MNRASVQILTDVTGTLPPRYVAISVVTGQEEHDLIFAALEAITSNGLWLGGYYDLTVAAGKWVNGETWSYTNFDANVLQMRNTDHEANRRWVFRSKYGGDKDTLCELEL